MKRVVLDPGHGGEETGAKGPNGLLEKDVTLTLCLKLERLLTDRYGFEVVMTRRDDRLVGLWDRPRLANEGGAWVFVSIHANGAPVAGATGVETYIMSLDAPDEEARQVAAMENGVVSAAEAPADVRGDVEGILWAVAQEEVLAESQVAAELVQRELNRSLKVPNRGIKQAPLVVLRNAVMPAVLVEVGFISNPKIEAKLRSSDYLDRVARAVALGIAKYRGTSEK